MPSEITDLIKSVPDVIWSAIVASGITLFGVMLSNRSNNSRLKLQLDHDASEKSKEKISDLRREVYLKAIEDIEITNLHIGNLANRDIASLNLTPEIQVITGSIAKLRLVAESKTSILAGNLGVEFGALFVKLLPRLAILQAAKTDIEINDDYYESSFAEASRLQRDMQRFNEEGRQEWDVYQTLKNSYEFKFGQSQEYAAARATAYSAHGEKLREFHALLLPEMKELSKVQLKVMVAIREDLGIACDVANLQRQLERQWAVMEAGYSDAMKDLKGE